MRLLTALTLFTALTALAPLVAQRTYCNPLDINYQYNFEQLNQGISYRSGADPVIINHRGEYYLFVTISGGYWHSKNLRDWQYVNPSRWPFEDNCAPAAWSHGDTLFIFQSTFEQRPILYTTRPETGQLEFYNRWLPPMPGDVKGPWDPALFRDDDGRWYMYFGSSNLYPIYGIELDPARRLAYRDTAHALMLLHPKEHGWERFGSNHTMTIDPYVEGAWMTKHGGKYYLQYGAPGTEYNVYANGAYVGDGPLGPFTYAPYNPVSYKPGGFMCGAGHGNTFQDNFGNYWNTGTPWVAVNWNFERRIAMFPAGFDLDGQMYSITRFGDFPHYLPTGKRGRHDDAGFTGWMLLSYKKPCLASSTRDTFSAARTTDENVRTYWVAQSKTPGEWLQVDLGHACEVRAVQVNYTDYESGLFASDTSVYTRFRLWHSLDGQRWDTLADRSRSHTDRPNAYVELPAAVRARYVRFEHLYIGGKNLAISDLRIFGNGGGQVPATPQGLRVIRQKDARNCNIAWQPVPGAVGYNIRWGIAPGKLYQTYQVWADAPSALELRALNVGQEYWFAIEAFDESGVSKVSGGIKLP